MADQWLPPSPMVGPQSRTRAKNLQRSEEPDSAGVRRWQRSGGPDSAGVRPWDSGAPVGWQGPESGPWWSSYLCWGEPRRAHVRHPSTATEGSLQLFSLSGCGSSSAAATSLAVADPMPQPCILNGSESQCRVASVCSRTSALWQESAPPLCSNQGGGYD